MKHRRINNIRPNVIRGGQAIPIGSNFYYMQGRKHEQGGIDIGKDLEVEGDEVMQITPKSVKVYSAQPILNGVSPAQAVLGGENPNKVFKAQEEFKDRFNLNDDGTKRSGDKKKAALGEEEEWGTPQRLVAASDNRPVEVVVTPQGSYTGYMTSENSPIWSDNDTRIAASEQGRIDRVNKQIADKERIDNGIKDAAKFVAENLPGIGEAITIKDAYDDYVKGNTLAAGIGLGSLVLPFGVNKIAKHINLSKAINKAVEHAKGVKSYFTTSLDSQLEKIKYLPNLDNLEKTNNIVDKNINNPLIEKALKKESDIPLQDAFGNTIDLNNVHPVTHTIYDGNPYYSMGTNDVYINVNHRDLLQAKHHEDNHYKRAVIADNINGEIYANRIDNYRKLNQKTSNITRVKNDAGAFTPEEQNILDKAYSFTDDFIKKRKGNISILQEKASSNIELKDNIINYFGLPNNVNIDTLNKYIDNLSNAEVMYLLRITNGYTQDFYRNIEQKLINAGVNMDAPIEVLYKEKVFDNPIIKENIKNIKEALKNVGIGAGVISTGNIIMNSNNNRSEMKYGGKLTIVPFTGRGKQSNTTTARMGTKKALIGTRQNNQHMYTITDGDITMTPPARVYTPYRSVPYVPNVLNSLRFDDAGMFASLNDFGHMFEDGTYASRFDYDGNGTFNIGVPEVDFTKTSWNTPFNRRRETNPTPAATTTEQVEDNQEYTPTKVLNHDYISPNGIIDYGRFIRPFRGTTPAATSTRKSRSTGQGRGTKPTNVKLDFGDTPTIDRSTPGLIRSKGDLVPNGINVNVNTDISGVTPPSIANPKVFNNTKSPKTSSRFKGFIKNNAEDIIGGASNLIGSVGSYIANNIALNRMKAPSEPAYKIAAKMKTTYNSNPEEDANRETYHRGVRSIRNNTASSNVAQNRINRLNLATNEASNRIRANKENIETQLINQDKMNQQQVANANVDTYNQYIDRINQFMNKKLEMKSENTNALIAGLNNVVQSTIANRQKRRQFDNNLKLINAMTPDVVKYLSKRV